MKPQDSLRESADVFEERGKVYGDAYKNFGHVLMALRPNGFAIRNIEDANRLGVLTQIVMKIVRYANQFEAGGHDDSLLDLSTYAAMLRELDAESQDKIDKLDPIDWAFKDGGPLAQSPKTAPPWKPEVEIEPVVPRREPTYDFPVR